MAMRDHNAHNIASFQGFFKSISVAVKNRAWVNHNNIVGAKNVCTRAVITEFRRVLSNDSLNQW
jgi:hypothetical protein